MAGVVLIDSFTAAQPAAERRMLNWWREGISLPAGRRRRRVIALPLHGLGAAFCVALDGEARPTAASSQLLVFSLAGTAGSRHPGGRVVLSAQGRTLGTGASFLPFCDRVDELLDASHHAA